MVEITMDGFVETLQEIVNGKSLDDDGFDFYAADLMFDMVRNGMLDLSGGPLAVYNGFANNADIVYRDDFEEKYPKYAEVMTWDEFVANECMYGNDAAAVIWSED